jgi:hypothetical protein
MSTANVWKSSLVGVVVGLLLQLGDGTGVDLADRLVTLLACGAAGLVVGLVTEWLTSLLPARYARTGVYFVVNNLVALAVAAAATLTLVALESGSFDGVRDGWPVLLVVVTVVAVANTVDYLSYRRTGTRLRKVQAALRDGVPDA